MDKPSNCTAQWGEHEKCNRNCEFCPRVEGFDYEALYDRMPTEDEPYYKPVRVRVSPTTGEFLSDAEAHMHHRDISSWPLATIAQLEQLIDSEGNDQAFCGPIQCAEGPYEFDWDKQIYEAIADIAQRMKEDK